MCFEFKNILEELECLFSLCTQWFAVIKLTPSYKDKLHSIRNTLLKPIPFLQQKIQTINNESLASKAIDFYITAGMFIHEISSIISI